MRNRRFPIDGWDHSFKHSEIVLLHRVRVPIPVVEISYEVGSESVGSPFAISDISGLFDDESVLFVTFRELVESSFVLVDSLYPIFKLVVSVSEWNRERSIEVGSALRSQDKSESAYRCWIAGSKGARL